MCVWGGERVVGEVKKMCVGGETKLFGGKSFCRGGILVLGGRKPNVLGGKHFLFWGVYKYFRGE